MKAIVYGQEGTAKKVTALLAKAGVMVEEVSAKFYEAISGLGEGQFDLAVVDSRAKTADLACHHIRKSRAVPLVLIVDPRRAAWDELEPFDADGYLPGGIENRELSARMRAMLRRLWPGGPVVKRNLVPRHWKILTKS